MTGDRRVDLARLAAGYDHRMEVAAEARAEVAAEAGGLGEGHVAVDVGGGRGRHGAVFANRGARVVLVDRSPDMALAAHGRGVAAVVGDAARLPLRGEIASLVYFHLAIHHGPADRWLAEAFRVVRPGGLIWVWTLAPEHHRTSFLTRWFPSVGGLDEARFQPPDEIGRLLRDVGCDDVVVSERSDPVERTAGSWETAVRAGFVSTLHLIDPEEIEAGLAAFATAHPDPVETIRYTLQFSRVSGRRPALPAR